MSLIIRAADGPHRCLSLLAHGSRNLDSRECYLRFYDNAVCVGLPAFPYFCESRS